MLVAQRIHREGFEASSRERYQLHIELDAWKNAVSVMTQLILMMTRCNHTNIRVILQPIGKDRF
jgi:hypothetical protein